MQHRQDVTSIATRVNHSVPMVPHRRQKCEVEAVGLAELAGVQPPDRMAVPEWIGTLDLRPRVDRHHLVPVQGSKRPGAGLHA